MKYLCGLIGLFILAHPVLAQTATEKAEKRLADLLAPGSSTPAVTFATQPVAWPASKAVIEIAAPMRAIIGTPARLPLPASVAFKPRSVPEGTPLLSFADESKAPKAVELPTKPLIRLPSLDVQTPLPIPILAQPLKDRASLGDPALEASLAAALKPFTPARTRPVPFVPLNLPDPFEHIRHGQLRNPLEESATPPVIPLTKPTK